MRVVVKLGGSLLDLPDLTPRLSAFLDTLRPARMLLVVGGGRAADRIRALDRRGELSGDEAHWRAIAAMSSNARTVADELGAPGLSSHVEIARDLTSPVVLDVFALLREDERDGGAPLPRGWSVTGDTIAARLAHRFGATKVILLKSCDLPAVATLADATERGVIDARFAEWVDALPVTLINFRREPPAVCCRWPPGQAQVGALDALR